MSQQALERMARPSCFEPDVFARMQAHQRTPESSRCVPLSRFHLVAHVVHARFPTDGSSRKVAGRAWSGPRAKADQISRRLRRMINWAMSSWYAVK